MIPYIYSMYHVFIYVYIGMAICTIYYIYHIYIHVAPRGKFSYSTVTVKVVTAGVAASTVAVTVVAVVYDSSRVGVRE